jgi:hypothetical protein
VIGLKKNTITVTRGKWADAQHLPDKLRQKSAGGRTLKQLQFVWNDIARWKEDVTTK